MKAKITKRNVEGTPPQPRAFVLFDTELPGFGCRVTPHGARSYVLKYSRGNRARWVTIGRHGDLTSDQARKEATRLRGLVAMGQDPAGDRMVARGTPTLAEFARRYLEEHARPKKKLRSVHEDERNLEKHIVPVLGALRLTDVTRADMQRFHHLLRATPFAANRCLALLSTMMNLAEKWGLRPDGSNPTRHVAKYRERRRERLLSPEEIARLGNTLRRAEKSGVNASVVAALRLLLFTGCRLREILTLRWEHVDLAARCLRLPDSKTGARLVPLGEPALAILSRIERRAANPHVLPGARPGAHYVGLEKAWARLRAAAGLPDVRIHDLRHGFASAGVARGESLPMVGKLLGHASPAMTARYAHLSADPLLQAADRISGYLAAALDGDVPQPGGARPSRPRRPQPVQHPR